MVYVLGDIDLPLRGRTYVEPPGAHVVIAGGDVAPLALEHVAGRADCLGVAIVGPSGGPPALTGLEALAGRRLLVVDPDGARMRSVVEAALGAGVEVEWVLERGVPREPLAAWALPVAGVVLAGPGPGGDPLRSVGGRPAAMHAVEAAREGGCHLAVALCAGGDSVAALAAEVEVVAGLGGDGPDALRSLLEGLPAWVAGAMVVRGDRVLAGSRTVAMLIRHWRAEHAPPAVALSDPVAGWGAPVVLERDLVADLRPAEAPGRGLPFELPAASVGTVGSGRGPEDAWSSGAGAVRVFRRRAPG